MNQQDQQLIGLMLTCCGQHRLRFGIKREPKTKDCEKLPCKTGCPWKQRKSKLEHVTLNVPRKASKKR